MPAASKIILPLDTGNTGKNVRTQTRDVGGETVHEHFSVKLDRSGDFFRMAIFGATYGGFAAGTATAGHIFAGRWGSSTHAARIAAIRMKRQVITAFTAAQEFATAIYRLTGYTVAHSGGTAQVLTAPAFKLDTSGNDTKWTDLRMQSGSALTAGTHTLDGNPMAADSIKELAAAATVPQGAALNEVVWTRDRARPLILRQNQGILVRNEILMGAGAVIRPIIEIDWEEILLSQLDF